MYLLVVVLVGWEVVCWVGVMTVGLLSLSPYQSDEVEEVSWAEELGLDCQVEDASLSQMLLPELRIYPSLLGVAVVA